MSRQKIDIFGQICGRGRPRPYFSHGPNWPKICHDVALMMLGRFPKNYDNLINTVGVAHVSI